MRALFPAGINDASDPTAEDIEALIDFVMREVWAALTGITTTDEDYAYMRDTVVLGVAHYLYNGVLPLANADLDSGQATFYRLRYVEHLGVLTGAPSPTTPGGTVIYDPIVA